MEASCDDRSVDLFGRLNADVRVTTQPRKRSAAEVLRILLVMACGFCQRRELFVEQENRGPPSRVALVNCQLRNPLGEGQRDLVELLGQDSACRFDHLLGKTLQDCFRISRKNTFTVSSERRGSSGNTSLTSYDKCPICSAKNEDDHVN
jgi:hypothetical protein